ncbi:E1A-binding protein p400-like isoform X1 [Neltuma alba]|uniref:E1A-binding protein p400-like isoform X1 n=1 Tax=Neltuma alba TaxID=207710 RepID=UPI0010A36082|nr:E1A-binding protein p400-like isoform X1 [Prosopis alba]
MPVDPNRATTVNATAVATALSAGFTSVTADTATTMVAPSRSLMSSQPSSPTPTSPLPQPPPHPPQLHKALHFPSQSLYAAQALPVRSPNFRPNSQLSVPPVPKGICPFSTDQMVAVSTHGGSGYVPPSLVFPHHVRARSSPQLDYLNHPLMTGLHNSRYPHLGSAVNGVPVSSHTKVAPRATTSNGDGYKDRRDRSRDHNLIIVKGRNVRITEDASLYALCRSWLRNITYEDWQVQQKDVIKELPKPLPAASVMCSYMSNKKVEEEQEDEKSVENLTPRDILQWHIKRSKRVRGRLREERLRRISRYRSRLCLLLPPPPETVQK